MKRKLSIEECKKILELANVFAKDYPRCQAYYEGYVDCAKSLPPLSAYTQAIQSLKSLRQHIESIPFADAVKMMEDSEAAGVVIEESAKYLP